MEGGAAKLSQEILPDFDQSETLFFNGKTERDEKESKIPKQTTQELAGEEETLKLYLDKLKKENFILQSSKKAWQETLETKQEEFKEADLKLEEIYNEIWTERENFCAKLDKFNEDYGVLSNWWEMQIRFVSESGNGCEEQEKVEKLELEVAELKREIEELQARKISVLSTVEEESHLFRNESTVEEPKEIQTEEKNQNEFLETDKKTEKRKEERHFDSDLYCLVDVEKVKMAKRRRKNSCLDRNKNTVIINKKQYYK